jgi:protein tyrosine/serine phosphatase
LTASPATTSANSRPAWQRRVTWIAATVLVVALLITIAWLIERFVFFNFHEVIPGQVYRAGQPSTSFLEYATREYHLRSVLKLNRSKESTWSRDEEETCRRLGVKLIYIPIGVTELPPRQDMLAVLNAIETMPTPVMIHCKNGADRTGFASILCAMRAGESLDQAWGEQMKLRYLRVGHLGDEVSDVFTQYRADCAGHANLGTWQDFRSYITESYWPGFYHATLEPQPNRTEATAGQVVHFKVKVTNASPRNWSTTSSHPFFLAIQTPRDITDPIPDNLAKTPLPELAAHQSTVVDLDFSVPNVAPGEHHYMIDAVQKERTTFFERGSIPADVTIVVK